MTGDHSAAAHALGSILKIGGTELQRQTGQFLIENLGDYAPVASSEAPGPRPADYRATSSAP
jgi:acyl-CoA dehydrogenase